MTDQQRLNLYNTLSILCGAWFILTGWIWGYYVCLIIAYPVGLLGLFFWYKGRPAVNGLNKAAIILLATGLILSVGFLLALLFLN